MIWGTAALPGFLLAAGAFLATPESPRWLLLAGKGKAAAREALRKARGRGCPDAASLEAELEEARSEARLRAEQEAVLKEALREVDRAAERAKLPLSAAAEASATAEAAAEVHYLKNVLLKLYETGEARPLLPVLARVLRFSPADVEKCERALNRRDGGGSGSGGGAVAGGDGGALSSLASWASWAAGGGGN